MYVRNSLIALKSGDPIWPVTSRGLSKFNAELLNLFLTIIPVVTRTDLCIFNYFLLCTGSSFSTSCFSLNASKILQTISAFLNSFSFVSSFTRSGSNNKLVINLTRSSKVRHFYFNGITRLWNRLPHIDLSLSFLAIKHNIYSILWQNFVYHFESDFTCTFYLVCLCNNCHLSGRQILQLATTIIINSFLICSIIKIIVNYLFCPLTIYRSLSLCLTIIIE